MLTSTADEDDLAVLTAAMQADVERVLKERGRGGPLSAPRKPPGNVTEAKPIVPAKVVAKLLSETQPAAVGNCGVPLANDRGRVFLGPAPNQLPGRLHPARSEAQVAADVAYVRLLSEKCSLRPGASKGWRPKALHLFSGSGALCEELRREGWVVESVDLIYGEGFNLISRTSQSYYLKRVSNH